MTLTEFKIIKMLAKHLVGSFSRHQIIKQVRDHKRNISPRTVDAHVCSLRRKLGSAGDMIQSIRGLGYRLRR
ncbi:MAG: winged helix-turn-helix domain-containing protein [Desulfurivibrio sp.]|nr:winged helix-turn-helix domain-containing protein [Desulfurivibrio sp.]